MTKQRLLLAELLAVLQTNRLLVVLAISLLKFLPLAVLLTSPRKHLPLAALLAVLATNNSLYPKTVPSGNFLLGTFEILLGITVFL